MKRCSLLLKTVAALAFTPLIVFHSMADGSSAESAGRPNILLFTADDMSWGSLGCTGCSLPGISPNVDRLAADGILIKNCHIVTPICGPSRHAMHTGQYPQRTGYMGHGVRPPLWWKNQDRTVTEDSIANRLNRAGYLTGLIGKNGSGWCRFDERAGGYDATGLGRDPSKYYTFTTRLLDRAKSEKQPFFLSANAHDPHRYWARHPQETQQWIETKMKKFPGYSLYPNGKPYPDPKTRFDPADCPMPACYPNEPWLRERIATYYDSVNRMDEVVGEVLRALDESGMAGDTLVLFLSDHGMGWLLSKWSLYPSGTRTPLIARWPGRIEPGQVDSQSVLSTVDIPPTLIEAAGCTPLRRIDGQSFLGLLRGDRRQWKRTEAFSCFNYMNNDAQSNQAHPQYIPTLYQETDQYRPSRALSSLRYTYIWNGWSDGRAILPVTMGGGGEVREAFETFADHPSDTDYPDYHQRCRFSLYRTAEELYDTQNDPGCLKNLAESAEYGETLETFRAKMLRLMGSTGDHEQENYRKFLKQGS